MSDIRFNQWLHQSGTGGVSQVASGAVGVGTTNPLADFYVRGDAQITGILTAGHIAMGSSITFGDGDRAYFGDGTDMQLYHNGTNSYIENGTNALNIKSYQTFLQNANGSEDYLKATDGYGVELYHNNNKRIETTGYGATVFGELDTTNLSISGITTVGKVNQTLYSPHATNWATRSALTLFGNYGGGLAFNDNNNNGWVQHVSGSGVDFWLKNGAVGGTLATSIKATKGGSVELYENNTKVFETASFGVNIVGGFVASGDCSIADKITHVGDLDTAIRFPAADTFSVDTGGSERLRINSDGRVIIGHSQASGDLHGPQGTTGRSPFIQLHGANTSSAGLGLISWKNSAGSYYAPTLYLAHSGSDTIGTNGVLPTNGEFGSIVFSGDDGTDFVKGAMIKARLDGTPGTDDMPGRLEFHTTPDGAQSPVERVRINKDGRMGIGNNNPQFMIHTESSGNNGGVRLENSHTTTTVSGNTAAGAFPHNLILSNYSGSGNADNRLVSLGFDIPTTVSHANAQIVYQATGSNGVGDLQFWLENANTTYERARFTAAGQFLMGTTSSTGARVIIQQNSSDTNPLDQQTCADSSGMRLQNYSFSTGRYTALSMECCNSSSVQSASIVAQSSASGTSPDIIFTQRNSNTTNAERLRINSDGYLIKAAGKTCAFNVRGSSNMSRTDTSGYICQFNDDTSTGCFDSGNNFNTSTYKFIAPVTGIYYFFTNIRLDAYSTGYIRTAFLSSNHGTSSYWTRPETGHVIDYYHTPTNILHISTSTVVQLDKDDELYVWQDPSADNSYTVYLSESQFGGYLIG